MTYSGLPTRNAAWTTSRGDAILLRNGRRGSNLVLLRVVQEGEGLEYGKTGVM